VKSIEVPYSKTLTRAKPLATRHLIKSVPASATRVELVVRHVWLPRELLPQIEINSREQKRGFSLPLGKTAAPVSVVADFLLHL
jgi:hypothetical protein